MTAGDRLGLSGGERRALVMGWVCAMTIGAFVIAVNVITRAFGPEDEPLARSLIEEGSSALSLAIAVVPPAVVALWMRRRRPPAWRLAPVIALGFLAFLVLHVGGFVLVRLLAEPAVTRHAYHFGPPVPNVLYEAAKDVLSYTVSVVGFRVMLGWFGGAEPAAAGATTFDIRDGARLIRTPVAGILAARSAGNYVEFLLADGRRPLMRTPLGGLEAQLRPHGFVRTHRSWLVNAGQVTGLRPEGSGDHTVELGSIEAPLSRRYREALAAIRTQGLPGADGII